MIIGDAGSAPSLVSVPASFIVSSPARPGKTLLQTQHGARIFRFALKFSLNVSRNSCQTPTRTIGNHMYLSLGKAAKEAGVAKSTISKALSSGKLSYREKNSDGYKIDPAELFRVYPKITKTDADELSSNDWQSGQAGAETMPYSAKFEIQLAGLKNSDRGKRPPHHRPRSRPRAASRGPPPAHRELAGGARPAPKIARGPDRHRQASDRRAEQSRWRRFNARSGSGFSAASRRWRPKDFDCAARRNGRGFGRLWGDISAVTRPGSWCLCCPRGLP